MPATNVTVIGLQWGDEGKGKIVDALARLGRYVVRYCGGANAGHSVQVDDEKFALHLIPSGILHDGVMNVVANGVAFDPPVALEEMAALRGRGVAVAPGNLCISRAAHVVMPYHKLEDRLSEEALGGRRLGTTARGIGPCYADKALRSPAVRVGDLTDPEALGRKLRHVVDVKNRMLASLYDAEPLDAETMAEEYADYGRQLAPMLANTGAALRRAIANGEPILFEGGQGSMLDIDQGTYPFVTSSMVTAAGVPGGAAVPPSAVGRVVGVIKAYTSRVGSGPFPSEQDNATGDRLRQRGNEYGTTTGRPRRCGWFDAFAVRYAADLSGVGELALSLLDVLTGLDEVRVCVGYGLNGRTLDDYDAAALAEVECVYETLPGWTEDISGCRKFEELPRAAQGYVERVEQLVGRPVGVISVGAKRRQTIIHKTHLEGLS